jgi:PPOX class probable F420-dependent enzyme
MRTEPLPVRLRPALAMMDVEEKGTEPVKLTEEVLALLRQPSSCYVVTLMDDGSPQVTQVWVDTDGDHVIINTVDGYVKEENMERDPRVAVAIADPDDRFRYVQVRGRVVEMTTEGGAEHIEALSQKYTGEPYPWYGGRDQTRVIVKIAADAITSMGM